MVVFDGAVLLLVVVAVWLFATLALVAVPRTGCALSSPTWCFALRATRVHTQHGRSTVGFVRRCWLSRRHGGDRLLFSSLQPLEVRDILERAVCVSV